MARVHMCDVCTDVIKQRDFGRIIDGKGRLKFKKDEFEETILLAVVDPITNDTIPTDICPECLLKGVVGLGG